MRAPLAISILCLAFACGDSKKEDKSTSEKEVELVPSPSANNSSLPYLIRGANDSLYLSWVEQKGDTTILKYASWDGQSWSSSNTIATGADWFVNWADYPMMATNVEGNKIAHYLAKSSAGTYSYDVNVVSGKGNSWSDPVIPHSDGTPTEHGFVTMLPLSSDDFQLAWLDGRNTSGGHGEGGPMTIRTAVLSSDGGLTDEYELDNRVCDCCQTTGALTENGPVFIYRDRSDMEVRDMSIVRLIDGEWTAPRTVYEDNWKIEGCPVNGPRAAAIDNTLAVALFSAVNSQPEVKVIFSEDGGESFSNPIIIDRTQPLGRVDVILVSKEEAMVSWLAREGKKTMIKAQLVNKSGQKQSPFVIAEGNESRGSGFPQMEYHDGTVWFAWTDLKEEEKMVRVARIDASKHSF